MFFIYLYIFTNYLTRLFEEIEMTQI